MSSATMSGYHAPTVEVTEPSDGHFLPFVVGIVLFLVSTIGSVMVVGLPH